MDSVTLRAIERILVVLFAGMAIYLGYRLFLAVPAQRDSDGRLTRRRSGRGRDPAAPAVVHPQRPGRRLDE